MPRIVSKSERQAAVTDATWSLIEQGGFENVTMRKVAHATGFTNGALKPYFKGKDDLMRVAYETAFQQVVEAQNEAVGDKTGLAGLRAFCEAAMPIDTHKVRIARIVAAFWEEAICKPELNHVYRTNMFYWDDRITEFLRQGIAEGTLAEDALRQPVIDSVIFFLTSVQVMRHICPHDITPERQLAVLDQTLAPLVKG
jgi:AcrR family transcriptional regulator